MTASMPRHAALALVLCLAGTPVAFGQDRVEARRHFQAGMALVQAGQYQEGIRQLEKAYEAAPHPSVLFNIGRAWLEADDEAQAIRYLERYVQSEPRDADQVRAFIEQLKRRQLEAEREAIRTGPERRPAPPQATAPAISSQPASVDGSTPGTTGETGALAGGTSGGAVRREDLEALIRQLAALSARLNALVEQSGTGAAGRTGPASGDGAALAGGAGSSPAGTSPDAAGATPSGTGATTAGVAGQTGTGPSGLAGAGASSSAGAGDAPGVASAAADPYAPTVVTSSRYSQSPLEAPNALTVLTSDDIRRSGARTLPEVLRRVPGLDVMAVSPGDYNLGIRGFNSTLANKVLVLVDGRSVYLDFVGATLWPLLSISLSDVERVEVIRGPGAALYGANAFSGVINIITKAPGAPDDRPQVTLRGGIPDWYAGDLHLTGRSGATAYRASAGFEQVDRWAVEIDPDRPDYELLAPYPEQSVHVQRLDARVDHRVSRSISLSLSGGTARGQSEFAAIGALRDFYVNGTYSYLRGDVVLPAGLSLRGFWNRFDADAAPFSQAVGTLSLASHPQTDVVDLEAEWYREGHLLVDHRLNLGVGYRFKTATWEWLGESPREHHFSFFVQDELRFTEELLGVVSLRLDRHPVLAERADAPFGERYPISPRGAVIWRFTQEQSVRATVGTAFRTPTFIENYIYQAIPTGTDAVAVLDAGNLDLAPERVLSAELGYLNQPIHSRYEVEGAAFFNRISGLVRLSDVAPWTDPATSYDPEQGIWYAGTTQFQNEDQTYYALGVELGGRWYAMDGVSLYGNYAFTRVEGEEGPDQSVPLHKVNAGIHLESRQGVSCDLDLSHVASQTWELRSFDAEGRVLLIDAPVPAYTRLALRLGYRTRDGRLETAIEGHNLLAAVREATPATGGAAYTPPGTHREHPLGQPIPLGVSAWLAVRF